MRRRHPLLFLATLAAAFAAASGAGAQHATAVCKAGYYENVSGHCIHRPSSSPAGATARCRDGTYYSEHASGTCSHHGGVSRWIRHP